MLKERKITKMGGKKNKRTKEKRKERIHKGKEDISETVKTYWREVSKMW